MSAPQSVFGQVPKAEPDPIFHLTASYKNDSNKQKVNLGIGAYRTDEGKPWVLPAVKKAELRIVNDLSLDHEYLPIEGLPSFTESSVRFILGRDHPVYLERRCISGTGAVRVGAEFLSRFSPATVYISNPTWANHINIFKDVGLKVNQYRYWNPENKCLDIEGMLADIKNAPDHSIILLHACAHNPTGVDPTEEQWKQIADLIESKNHVTFFDSAYQGFASGDLDRDAYAVRYFAQRNIEFLIAQSYSKNFGLYNERCGCLVVTFKTASLSEPVRSQLARIARPMISNPPAFGARIVNMILNDEQLFEEWTSNLRQMSGRIEEMRKHLYEALQKRKTPGTWHHIIEQIEGQVQVLKEKYHIYLSDNGRISMAGLNSKNVEYFADAVDDVVRNIH